MFRANPEAFLAGVVRLVNEQKATLVVDNLAYDQVDGRWDSAIFTALQCGDVAKAFKSKKNVQDWIFPDGYAMDGESVERRFAEDMGADERREPVLPREGGASAQRMKSRGLRPREEGSAWRRKG